MTKTEAIDVVVETPAPVTAASAVVSYPSVLPPMQRRADIGFRVTAVTVFVLGGLSATLLALAATGVVG